MALSVVELLRGWPHSWPRSERRLSLGLTRGIVRHLVSSPDKATCIERGGMHRKGQRELSGVGCRTCSAGRSSKMSERRDVVDGAGTEERLEVLYPGSKATVPVEVHCLSYPDVCLLVRERFHVRELAEMCRLGSQSVALQRRLIDSDRHSWLPRCPTKDSETPRQG